MYIYDCASLLVMFNVGWINTLALAATLQTTFYVFLFSAFHFYHGTHGTEPAAATAHNWPLHRFWSLSGGFHIVFLIPNPLFKCLHLNSNTVAPHLLHVCMLINLLPRGNNKLHNEEPLWWWTLPLCLLFAGTGNSIRYFWIVRASALTLSDHHQRLITI